jgi:acyl-CoA dehydrogenase
VSADPRGSGAVLASLLRPQSRLEGGSVRAFLDAGGAIEGASTEGAALDAAIMLATRADRLGYAFAAGYVAAGRALAALTRVALPAGSRVSLAATEEGGAHPRAIHTTFDGHTLDGTKLWTTLALEATHLLVIARAGERDGRPRLVALLLPAERDGLELEEMPAPPFCPEIRHAKLSLRGVRVEPHELLPVDGFADVLRPFRTLEDVCVISTAVAWLCATGLRLGMPRELAARAASIVLGLREIGALAPSDPATHVALGGAIELATAFVQDVGGAWPCEPADERDRFERDRGLLQIASRVRKQRLDKAWAELSGDAR